MTLAQLLHKWQKLRQPFGGMLNCVHPKRHLNRTQFTQLVRYPASYEEMYIMLAQKPLTMLLPIALLMGVFVVTTLALEAAPQPFPPAATNTVDVAVESFSLTPPTGIAPRQPLTLTAVIRNIGSEAVAGRRVYLYINPTERPPLSTTVPTKEFVVGITWPAGDAQMVEYGNFSINLTGCDNVAYVWVDPLNRLTETDETNNRQEIHFCVTYPNGTIDQADSYETDNLCDQAQPITTDGRAQVHNFTQTGDIDWVKFTATQNVTHTITAAGTGPEADPNLEIWDSCGAPPSGAFGTLARLQQRLIAGTTYYIRVNNDHLTGSPATTSYELMVDAELSNNGPGPTPSPVPLPAITSVQPAQGSNDRNTNLLITGANWVQPTMAELCPLVNNQCATNACRQILDLSYLAATQSLYAIVQANAFAAGPYCLAVTNQGGRTGYLPNAFTVLPGAPAPQQVIPAQTYNDQPINLTLYGYNFFDGLLLTLTNGSITATLENIAIVSRTQVRATIPAHLPAGSYTLSAAYVGVTPVNLPAAFTVLQPTEDLFAQSAELWSDPVAPHAGEPARLGVIVHRLGGTAATVALVRFTTNNTVIGDAETPLLAPDSQASTEWLTWTPQQAGDYTISAWLDPNNGLLEASESNNIVTRTITVLPAAVDQAAPRVDWLTIGDGRATITTTQSYLNAGATDYPLANPSGIASLRYIEFEYNAGNRLWLPVQDSQWLDYAQARQNYRWLFSPVGGNHYVQAWAKDNAGNISTFPYQTSVDYLPPVDRVGRDQTRFYRRALKTGDSLAVTVHPLSGDPDLYIWPPNWKNGAPPWVSNRTGVVDDIMVIPSLPVSGVYQIEVYGYAPAQYSIDILVNGAPGQRQSTQARGGLSTSDGKPTPTAPLLDPGNAPPRNLAQIAATPTPLVPTMTPTATPPLATTTPIPTVVVTSTPQPPTGVQQIFLPITRR